MMSPITVVSPISEVSNRVALLDDRLFAAEFSMEAKLIFALFEIKLTALASLIVAKFNVALFETKLLATVSSTIVDSMIVELRISEL